MPKSYGPYIVRSKNLTNMLLLGRKKRRPSQIHNIKDSYIKIGRAKLYSNEDNPIQRRVKE